MKQVDQGQLCRRLPGSSPLSRQREEFARLTGRGVSNAEACRIVGINRRTGTRWLYGRIVPARDGSARHYPAMIDATKDTPARSARYLSELERCLIADGRRRGLSMRALARQMRRDVSTISRELSRNRDQAGRYWPSVAHRAATSRLSRPRVRKVAADTALAALVQGWLDVKWSPEQISAALRLVFGDDGGRRLCTETIYQALYAKCPVLQRDPTLCLNSGRRRRRAHRRAQRRRAHPQTRPSIRDRPTEAQDRQVPGHWEGDLITGRANRSAIATVVDRTTGFMILVHLPGRHTAQVTSQALTRAFATLPPGLRRSLTWDCGTEMADHAEFSAATGVGVYFADPHSPWQRGTNENANGLLRQHFPKGTNLAIHSPQRLAEVQDELNSRPRKRHGWATPAGRLTALQSPCG